MPTIPLFAPPAPAPSDKESLEFMTKDLERSALSWQDLNCYPIDKSRYGAPAYVIPYNGNDSLYRVRIDRKENKYISTPNTPPDIWLPPNTSLEDMFDGDLFVVEGEKKAAAMYKHWQLQNVVGIGGCWNALSKTPNTDSYKLIERLQLLMVPGRKIRVVLDGDVIENKHVGRAALTLRSCIEAMNAEMYLYRPPEQYKGVDDWIQADAKASVEQLELIDYSRLAINRALLYKQLGCSVNAEGALICNELNGALLLAYHFASLGIMKDKRLGFIDSAKRTVTPSNLASIALRYLQGDISPRYPSGAINGALGDYIGSSVTEVDLVKDLVANRLPWDGTPRLESWGSDYFECETPKLAAEWGRILITSMALRILDPGCKVDTVCILSGKQGIGKTTFFSDLARIDGFEFYKSVTDLPGSTGDDRTFKQTLVAALVVDLGEGVIFESKKTSSDRLKQFITDQQDEYRVAYAKHNTVAARGFVIVGTTNRSDQLTDYTGSRRFLYLDTTKIKRLEYEIKLQLLAEVAARYDEIRSSNWYDLRLTLADLPQKIREENEHVTQVNELLNVDHYRADALTDSIRSMIENDDFSTHKADGLPVAVAGFVAARLGQSMNIGFINTVSRKFIELSSSPTFPYTFEKTRKRGAQLEFKQGHKELYTGHITNDQVMFTCFVIRKK